jgi:hypothetical protein
MYPDPLYLIAGMTQELGEIAAIITKLQRGFNKREQKKAKKAFIKECGPENAPLEDDINMEMLHAWWEKKLRAKLGPEVADLFTYLDLFATRQNITLPVVAANKFNEVSTEMECPYYTMPVESTDDPYKQTDIPKFPEDKVGISRDDLLRNTNKH